MPGTSPAARTRPDGRFLVSRDITRFIIRHYRHDPTRRERRHVVVAAPGNEPEFRACIEGVRAEIADRRDCGEHVDPREHASGVVHEPGYLRRASGSRSHVSVWEKAS